MNTIAPSEKDILKAEFFSLKRQLEHIKALPYNLKQEN